MKLRPRTQRPTDNSSTVTATVPVLPPNITRLQTPPISELSNAGSTIARKNRLSELSGTLFERSDTEETINSVSPTKNRTRPTITIPTAPLTKRNLAKHQEQIDSAVEVASEDERSPPPTTPNTRLVQARNFLLAENTGSYPDFATRLELIEHFLRDIPQEKEKSLSSIYYEVKDLLRVHRLHTIAGVEPSIQRRPHKEAFRPVMSLPAGDDLDPEKQADPFEWTNKLDDLTERVKKSPSGGKEALSSNIRELARPLHGGRLPSLQEAYCLINERVIKENHENKTPNEINHDRLWAFERTLQPASKERKFSLDRWSGHPPERSTVPAIKLGEGSLMPQEMMDIDWDRDRSRLEDSLEGHEDVDRGEAQLLLAETPLLQALMSEQIENDLAARVKKGKKTEPLPRKPAVLMTQKFALPRPAQSRIDEAAEIARALNIQPDPPTPSPRTALFRKRKFEQCSDSESEEEEGEDRRPGPTAGRADGVQGQRVYPEMSGALQEGQDDDDMHLYSDD